LVPFKVVLNTVGHLSRVSIGKVCAIMPATMTCQIHVGKINVGKIIVGQIHVGKIAVGQTLFGKIPVGKTAVSQIHISQIPVSKNAYR